ncbi:mannan endo-1,6-alpha-mannosidase [Lecanosticta acicola]|uniref:Mannan endo-1,6-alpha-mannosidase n=1 Tax=Lecanosticta acicola TaxID=111012 RepID=A0AAI8YYI8_9PEZI|nr:mannan endo-1,6-alpha-mannosidase [Lecanosticta acicola]
MRFLRHAAALVAAAATSVSAISLDLQSPVLTPTCADSIKMAAATVAKKMVAFYPGDQPGGIPGLLGDPYYWWEAGGMFGSLIDYWYYTGDDQYNNITTQALVFQLSSTYNYMPPNQSKSEGNDDQIFWAFAVMTAAEYKYPNPPDGTPAWVSIAAAVFNSQAIRWDNTTCAGGLRWQIFTFNNGYNYKNSPSNAGFLNLAARLYAYTGNQTYADWVEKTWDWMTAIGLLSPDSQVFDGTNDLQNCTELDHVQWTYSAGMMLNAAAVMWNATNGTAANSSTWETRLNGLWTESANVFFKDKVMLEIACEPGGNCNIDQQSFKAYFTRFVVASTKWAPQLYNQVMPYIQTSAQAAAAQCSGGTDGITCGTKWTTNGVWDGTYGVGQQLCALEIIQSNLIQQSYAPVTASRGGISQGNASLGTGGDDGGNPIVLSPITTADRAGAGIVTIVVILGTVAGGYWIIS